MKKNGICLAAKRNNYRLIRLDNTNWISTLEKGNEIYLNVFKALNDDYESYEMEYFKKMAEKQIVNGTRNGGSLIKFCHPILILRHLWMDLKLM